MQFKSLSLKGAYLITPDQHHDQRGYFARTFCRKEFRVLGLVEDFVQCSTSYNLHQGIIRGMHYQENPHAETKLVRCTRGRIFDVILDLRPDSPTYQHWHGEILSAENAYMLYIPKNFAHGFQVLENNSEVFYMMDEYHEPSAAREIALDTLTITWPLTRRSSNG